MKKAVSWFFSVVIMLAVAVPLVSAQGVSFKERRAEVYTYLTEEIGFNTAAACGIMANIEHESYFDPTKVIRDVNGRLSGGLCMWNGGRFSNLQSFCYNNGYNYLSIKGQLAYLKKELSNPSYKRIYNYMKNVPNSSSGAYDSAYYWCYYFEIPSNRAYQASKRGNSAISTYWNNFSNVNMSTPVLKSSADGKKLDLGKTLNLSWSSCGTKATQYSVLVAKQENGKFDFSKAKRFASTKLSFSLPLKSLGKGKYAVKVIPVNDFTGIAGHRSNAIKFVTDCFKHDFVNTDTVEPTFDMGGIRIYRCSKCRVQKSSAIPRLTMKKYPSVKVEGFKVKKRTATSATLKWKSAPQADSYRLYKKCGKGDWKKLGEVKKSVTEFTAKKLSKNKDYAFRIRAVAKNGNREYLSAYSTLGTSTPPKSVAINKIVRYVGGRVQLSWNKSPSADGYTVFYSTKPREGYKAAKSVSGCSATVGGLKKGVTYYFVVKAYKEPIKGSKIYSGASSVKYAVAR